jgi:hypothetical protein
LIGIIDIEKRFNLFLRVLEPNLSEHLHELREGDVTTVVNIKEFEHFDEVSFFTRFGT